ncbi:MAG: winged helix-turn-helix transcriptional regulator [Clostridia bacterium]|nr:winged helix-turn-helix transcriptional regulator [Clostridia bacterium]
MKDKSTDALCGAGAGSICDETWSVMTDLWFELDALSRKCAGICGLSETGYAVLCNLFEYGEGRTQTDVYKSDILNKQTVNSGVKQLIAEGVLRAEVCGRQKKLFLTEKGKDLMKNRILPLVQMDNDAFCAMDLAERQKFILTLRTYKQNFEHALSAFVEKCAK